MARKNSSKLNSCNPLFLARSPSNIRAPPVFFSPHPPVSSSLAASFIRRNGFSFLPSFLFFFTLFPVVRVLNIRVILCFSSVSSFERGRGLIRCRATIKRCAPLAINPPLSRENIARIPREQCRRREAIGIFNTRFLLALPSILALEICRLIWNRMF